MLTWGLDSWGQLGRNYDASGQPDIAAQLTPTRATAGVRVALGEDCDIASVVAGRLSSYIITTSGDVAACGYNSTLQLGTNCAASPAAAATNRGGLRSCKWASLLKDVASMAAGSEHALALTKDGRVLSFGADTLASGCLGRASQWPEPQEVQLPAQCAPGQVVSVAAGDVSGFTTLSGEAYVWGSNGYWQLGRGGSGHEVRPTPTRVGKAHECGSWPHSIEQLHIFGTHAALLACAPPLPES